MQVEHSVAGFFTPYQYEDITVVGTAGGVGLTQTKVLTPNDLLGNHARLVVITSEVADCRYSVLASVPPVAGGSGHLFPQGSMLTLSSLQTMKAIAFINETGTAAKLRVTYYR